MVTAKYSNGLINIKSKPKYKLLLFIIILLTFRSVSFYGQNLNDADSLRTDSITRTLKSRDDNSTKNKQAKTVTTVSDTVQPFEKAKKSPAKASLYSAILPGLGQTYNGNYWKVPIIYSAFAGIYFLAEENNYKYQEFKEAYKNISLGLPVDEKFADYDKDALEKNKDYYKRNRDLNYIMGALFYLLNILDANVDANLMDYDINPDLSLKVKPEVNNFFVSEKYSNNLNFGIKFVLSLH
jgi:hypothetical protein